jgi:coenzyme F420-reducing hydrogenase alpha subunit
VSDSIRTRHWGRQIDDMMTEITRQAAICQIKLLDPGVIDAVLHNNDSVCGNANPRSFKKLRELLMLGFMVREKAVDKLGPVETQEMIDAIRERLTEHLGGRMGGSG